MSNATITNILERIDSATKSSPIAVFASMKLSGKVVLDAVFYDTVESRRRAKNPSENLVGIYNRTMKPNDVKAELLAAQKFQGLL